MATESIDYCREIEAYLCRKNDGHLIRVVGPSFDIVSAWAARGVPLKIAFEGIDRYFERYHRKESGRSRHRRPVRIDFCDADVLDVFDEWSRALGLAAPGAPALGTQSAPTGSRPSGSLSGHLQRVLLRLTAARASGKIDEAFDTLVDGVARELDVSRTSARGGRGDVRQALLDRLGALDGELLQVARAALDEPSRAALAREAEEELSGFRASMTADGFARAREAAVDRLVRQRFELPVIAFP